VGDTTPMLAVGPHLTTGSAAVGIDTRMGDDMV